jgi:GNAT superfamily N-acetyltransferase
VIRVVAEDAAAPDSLLLMAELSAVLAAITGDSGTSSFAAQDVQGARARFLVARDAAGRALGCGALRPLEQGVAELKRMYARPGMAGIGSAILAALESEAATLGYRALWLSTRRVNGRAVAFYERRGYARIPNYGSYAVKPESVCFEKTL